MDKEQHHKKSLQKEQLRLLFNNVLTSSVTYIVVSITLLYLLWPLINHSVALSWFTVLMLAISLRSILFFLYKKHSHFFSVKRWHQLFVILTLSTAMVWGATSWLLFPENSTEFQVILLLFVAGLSAGSVTTLSVSSTVSVPFLLITLLPLMMRFFSSDSDISFTIGFITLFFLLMLLISSRRMNQSLIENIELRLQGDIREKKLQHEYNNSQQYLDIAGVIIVALDSEANVILLNKKGRNILGYELAEILHKNWFDLVIPEGDRKGINNVFHQVLQGRINFMEYYENEIVTKDGERRLIAWHNSLVKDEDDCVVGTLSSGEDITEHKKTEIERSELNAQLLESEEKYRRFFELSDDPMWIIVEDKFMMANQSASRILGYDSTEELIASHPSEISPEYQNDGQSSYKKANQMMKQAFKNGYHRFEWLHKKKNGEIFTVEVTLTKIPYSGKEALFCVWRDISNFKATEKALINARNEAEQSASAKGQFLATMSHEIRTPMNGVLGVAQLLEDTSLDTVQKEYVDTILDSGQALIHIINDILDFSKIDAGEMKLDPVDFSLEKTIREVVDLLSSNANEKGIKLIVDIAPDCPAYFKADTNRLRQVLFNLIGNAIKFTEEGHIIVRVKIQKLSGNIADILIEIEDSGVGIRPEAQKKLFSPFIQADASTTRTYGGTGLGLTISKRIIELMGGKISFESVSGYGTIFYLSLSLPVVDYVDERKPQFASVENKAADNIVENAADMRILLVEDNITNQKIAAAMLKRLNHQVTIANNGQEAVDFCKNDTFDLVFMDCQMPVMDGYEATKIIRNMPGEPANVPIVALTANAMHGDRQMCLDAGMNDFVSKPIKKEHLAQVVSLWNNRKSV